MPSKQSLQYYWGNSVDLGSGRNFLPPSNTGFFPWQHQRDLSSLSANEHPERIAVVLVPPDGHRAPALPADENPPGRAALQRGPPAARVALQPAGPQPWVLTQLRTQQNAHPWDPERGIQGRSSSQVLTTIPNHFQHSTLAAGAVHSTQPPHSCCWLWKTAWFTSTNATQNSLSWPFKVIWSNNPAASRETFNYIKAVQSPIQPDPESFQRWDICINLHYTNQIKASFKQPRHMDTQHRPLLTFLPQQSPHPVTTHQPITSTDSNSYNNQFCTPCPNSPADPVWYIFISNHIVAQRNYSLVYKSALPPVNSSQLNYTQWCLRKKMVTITKTALTDLISKKLQVEKIDEGLKLFKKRLDGQKLQSFNQERRQLYLKAHPDLLAKGR